MDGIGEHYDFVILGTGPYPGIGLTECILSGYLSTKGKKILHLERDPHYGGDSASVNLERLWRMLDPVPAGEEPWLDYIGIRKENREKMTREELASRVNLWNIDLVPKFLMADGLLTHIIVKTEVCPNYVEFGPIDGSYVYKAEGTNGRVSKVPSTAMEAMSSDLMGFFEKRRAKSFLEMIGNYNDKLPPSAQENVYKGLDLSKSTMKQVYDKAGLESATRDFIGHSLALFPSDDYLDKSGVPMEAIQRIRLYVNSMSRFGNSPYIYPRYGLGDLPQAFSRRSAVHGGTFLLETNVDEVMYDEGKVSGIRGTWNGFDGEVKFSTKTSAIIADPSYFESKTKMAMENGKPMRVLKTICILDHPFSHQTLKESCKTMQLIIPWSQIGRQHDIYVALMSSQLGICPDGYYIAIVSTIAERDISPSDPNFDAELQPGYNVLNPILKKFKFPPKPLMEPQHSGESDNIFLSRSYDAASHWESTVADIEDIYYRATGEKLKLDDSEPGAS